MEMWADKKYTILTRILDEYVKEGATLRQRRTFFDTSSEEKQNQARARAFIHLYLASTYGVVDFEDRELMITDSSNDGGIDAYYIDTEHKVIDVIQSKFRIGATNFQSKNISPEDLLRIDLDNILEGNTEDGNGNKYNGYIQAFIEKIKRTPDIARYRTKVTILANVRSEQYPLVERLFHGDAVNIVNFERCYAELVLPTIRGEQHYSSSLRLMIDMSNKSGNSRLSAEINTAYGPSELTVILVPTIEIAQIMSRFKNSILRYNPRSYLEFREQRTNEGIKESIVDFETGEFAILNNGITIVSDETHVNQRVGSKNKAQVEIVNPQVINGGQTAFTLARIFDESSDLERERLFAGKEVVVRIITLPQVDEMARKDLILKISSATNSQTTVSSIDRTASNDQNRRVAEIIFNKTGLLYEPKRGEYSDALRNGFIDRTDIIDRTLFTRLMNMASGRFKLAVERKMMRSTGGIVPTIENDAVLKKFMDLYSIFSEISGSRHSGGASEKIISELIFVAFVYELKIRREKDGLTNWMPRVLEQARVLYEDFAQWARENVPEFAKGRTDSSGLRRDNYALTKWRRSARYEGDVTTYFQSLELVIDTERQIMSP